MKSITKIRHLEYDEFKKLRFSSTFPKMLLIAWKLGPKSSVLKLSVGALQVSMT